MSIIEDVEFGLIVDDIAGEFDCLEHLNCCENQIIFMYINLVRKDDDSFLCWWGGNICLFVIHNETVN